MLKIRNLSKYFGNIKAVDDISFDVYDGEIFGFLGPNGAGKTTTIKIISGILKPDSGNIFLDDIDIIKKPVESKKKISYIPDEPFVYDYLTAREFLNFISEIYEIPDSDTKINHLLEFFNLKEYENQLLKNYSHGMKQKLLIASIILRKPRLMLFDEPTVGLDPLSVKKFKEILKELTDEGISIFMSTHILELAEKLCNRIAIIYRGRIITVDSVERLKMKSNQNKSLEDIFIELTT